MPVADAPACLLHVVQSVWLAVQRQRAMCHVACGPQRKVTDPWVQALSFLLPTAWLESPWHEHSGV